MVLEQLLEKRIVLRHVSFLFCLSLVYVFVAFGVQYFFFPGQSSATVLLATILLLPSLHHVVGIEESLERKGSSHWWKRHHVIIRCYVGAFLGVLLGFLLVGFVTDGLGYQEAQLTQSHMKPELLALFTEAGYTPAIEDAFALFTRNLEYLLIAFGLSIFYGAGAIFLIVYNASFFAAFIRLLAAEWPQNAMQLASVAFLHMIPESFGFLCAAIGGAILSYALTHEKLGGKPMKAVIRNCFIWLILGVLLVLIAAFVEVFVTAQVFSATLT